MPPKSNQAYPVAWESSPSALRVVVLNGSPKGEPSVTMQYVRYFAQCSPRHHFSIVHISRDIDRLVASPSALEDTLRLIQQSDLVLWATPVYAYGIPAQLKQFIELVFGQDLAWHFRGRYSAVLTTSSHLHDHLAHRYMNAIIDDLGMKYVGAFSAERFDLFKPKYQKAIDTWAGYLFHVVGHQEPVPRNYLPLSSSKYVYQPTGTTTQCSALGRRVVVLSDCQDQDSNLNRMVQTFVNSLAQPSKVYCLRDIGMQGGCCGAMLCGFEHACSMQDGFVDFYEKHMMSADVVVFAGNIVDRHLSFVWKEFFDRTRFHGHAPSLAHKQIAWLISGPLRQIPSLRDFFETFVEMQMANLVDVVTDEDEDSALLDSMLGRLALRAVHLSSKAYVRPPTFLGVGGMKVGRHIVERDRFLFQADYPFYQKKLGYDLAPNTVANRVKNWLLYWLTKVPSVRRYFELHFNELLIEPYKKLFDERKG